MSLSYEDRSAIEQLLFRYAWMVDRREWGSMDAVFAPDATIDYASTGGPGALPYREALAWLDRALAPWPINLHHITNIMIEIDGDRGKARCYFTAPMGRVAPDGGREFITNAGFYLDEIVRTSDGWRIAARFCDMTVQIGGFPTGYAIPD
jgi:3-phenylpropionate/cinnamic acid dioxygenase small subunit